MMHKAWRSIEEVPYCFFRSSIKFQGYMGKKMDDLIPIFSKITRLAAAFKFLRFVLFWILMIILWDYGNSVTFTHTQMLSQGRFIFNYLYCFHILDKLTPLIGDM